MPAYGKNTLRSLRVACYLLVALLLCGITVAWPMFAAPLPFLAVNVAGTALVSYGLGPWAGGAFGAFTHAALNGPGMGSGIIGYVLLVRFAEGALPGALDRLLKHAGVFWNVLSPCVGALALTVSIKPLSTALAWLLSPYAGSEAFLPWFSADMRHYLESGLGNTGAAYALSCGLGWGAARALDRIFTLTDMPSSAQAA